ncbi:MAG: SGNH hydrolase domain-containing protein, partial [Bdellovibrionota bacterium]
AAVVGIGFVAHRFIERPWQIRMRSWLPGKVVAAAFGMIVVVLGLSLALANAVPKPFRIIPSGEQPGMCFLAEGQSLADYDREKCVPQEARPTWLLWGDSHAAHYFFGLRNIIGDRGRVFQATYAGCSPLPVSGQPGSCPEFGKFVREDLIPSTTPEVILVGLRWGRDENRMGLDEMKKALRSTLRALGSDGRRIVVLGPGPEFLGDVRLLLDARGY